MALVLNVAHWVARVPVLNSFFPILAVRKLGREQELGEAGGDGADRLPASSISSTRSDSLGS